MVSGWTLSSNRITVDPQAGCVSYQQADECIIFSLGGGPRVQFVNVERFCYANLPVKSATPFLMSKKPALSASGRRRVEDCVV
jgi:hypothetical protein